MKKNAFKYLFLLHTTPVLGITLHEIAPDIKVPMSIAFKHSVEFEDKLILSDLILKCTSVATFCDELSSIEIFNKEKTLEEKELTQILTSEYPNLALNFENFKPIKLIKKTYLLDPLKVENYIVEKIKEVKLKPNLRWDLKAVKIISRPNQKILDKNYNIECDLTFTDTPPTKTNCKVGELTLKAMIKIDVLHHCLVPVYPIPKGVLLSHGVFETKWERLSGADYDRYFHVGDDISHFKAKSLIQSKLPLKVLSVEDINTLEAGSLITVKIIKNGLEVSSRAKLKSQAIPGETVQLELLGSKKIVQAEIKDKSYAVYKE